MSMGHNYRNYNIAIGMDAVRLLTKGSENVATWGDIKPKQLLPEPDFSLDEIERANEELLRDRH